MLLGACTPVSAEGDEILLGVMRQRLFGGFLFGYPKTVYLISPDGSEENKKILPWTSIDKPVWSPDGEWAVFNTKYSVNEGIVYVSKADGSQPQRVTYHDGYDGEPIWSPDGMHIAYTSSNTEYSQYRENGIYILNVECAIKGKECDFAPVYLSKGSSPDWSPDGKQIVFEMGCVEKYQLCVNIIALDTPNQPKQLTPETLSCHNPQWSPNGEKIAMNCFDKHHVCCDGAGIYTVNVDGSNFKQLTDMYAGEPQWSPDGSKIAFISSDSPELNVMIGWEAGFTSAVYIMKEDGTERTRLSLRNNEDVLWFTWLPEKLGFKS